jgi:hypothetical protein
MPVNRNISYGGFWTVPAGRRLLLRDLTASGRGFERETGATVVIGVKKSMDGDLTASFYGKAVLEISNTDSTSDLAGGIGEMVDLRITTEADGNGRVSSTLTGILEPME